MAKAKTAESPAEIKLKALYTLQSIDSKIDKIRQVRGELPLEVRDLEDEIAGLEIRISKSDEEIESLNTEISNFKNQIKESETLLKKYSDQQNNVRNSREFDSLTKEIEFQNLEIQLAEKRIKEFKATVENKSEVLAEAKAKMDEKKSDLAHKKEELDSIIAETEKEETALAKKSAKAEKDIDERLITAYKRIRDNARNGLAVVPVERDACGGCFNKIPPQRQLDIATRKKIIVCEHCGRILVDLELSTEIDG